MRWLTLPAVRRALILAAILATLLSVAAYALAAPAGPPTDPVYRHAVREMSAWCAARGMRAHVTQGPGGPYGRCVR